MTRDEFDTKINELLDMEFLGHLHRECLRLYDSGGIDINGFGDEFALPKLIATVALENCNFAPLKSMKRHQQSIKNLRKF